MFLSVAPMYGSSVQSQVPYGMNILPSNIGLFPGQGQGHFPNTGLIPNTSLYPSTGQYLNVNQFPTTGQFTGMGQFPSANIFPGRPIPIQVPGQQLPFMGMGMKLFPGQGIIQQDQGCPSDEDFQREVENDPNINDIVDQVIQQIPPDACGVRPPQHRREERVVDSRCPPRTAVIRRRMASPEPDIVERTTIVRAPQDTINIVIEKPGMPPPCVYETTDYEPEAPPRINHGVVCVQPSGQCPGQDDPYNVLNKGRFNTGNVIGAVLPQQTPTPWTPGGRIIPGVLPPLYQQQLPMNMMYPQSKVIGGIGGQIYPQTFNYQYPSSSLSRPISVQPYIANRFSQSQTTAFQQFPSSQSFGQYGYNYNMPGLAPRSTINYPLTSNVNRVMPTTSTSIPTLQPTMSTTIPSMSTQTQSYYWPQT